MKIYNLILMTDSYKTSHFKQLPSGTEYQFSYIESRGGVYDKVVWFGLQVLLQEILQNPVTMDDVDEAEEVLTAHGVPFNREGWEYIAKEHKGVLPLEIRAVPEGCVVPVKNALATVVNTDPEVPWVVSYFETILLRAAWYGSTVATQSWHIKQDILQYLKETGSPETIDFKLHDFGARGVSSSESAQIGAMAHLVNFQGTDTIEGLLAAQHYYNADMAGFSIPASEHSTITAWERDRELDAYRNMIEQFAGPGKMFACVSDSYDIYKAIDMWKELEPLLLEKGGTLVIRPDSGVPVDVIAGYKMAVFDKENPPSSLSKAAVETISQNAGAFRLGESYFKIVNGTEWQEITKAEAMGVVLYAISQFGYKMPEDGLLPEYMTLSDHIRVIQGDGVNRDSINAILSRLKERGVSADNIAFGMGGGLLQAVDRDTQKFAMKCSAVYVDGRWVDVFKDPVTDPGKASKKGRMSLFRDDDGSYRTLRIDDIGKPVGWTDKRVWDAMKVVYRNGDCCFVDFETVRSNAKEG